MITKEQPGEDHSLRRSTPRRRDDGHRHKLSRTLINALRLRTMPLFFDRVPIATCTLAQVEDRNLVLTCHHVWKIAPERIMIGQRDQPRKNVLLSDGDTDVAIIEVLAAAEFWFRDASGLELRSQFAPIDIAQLRRIEVRGRPIAGHGYPTTHLDSHNRICRFSSYFGKERLPPEEYDDIPDSRFCVRAEITRKELADDFPTTPMEKLDFKGMSGGPVYMLTETSEMRLCGLQCGQLREKISEERMVIWMTVVRPDVLADCIERALTS